MFRDFRFVSRSLQLAAMAAVLALAGDCWAAPATPLDTDVDADGLNFTGTDAFAFGPAFGQDTGASFNGNDILVQTMIGQSNNTGAGISVPVSNGENGIDQSLDGPDNTDVNADTPNATPANSVFATIGNASGKLENGNVIRYSMWVREDPNDPITTAPQIEPVLKFEFWKEAFGSSVDNNPGQAQPLFGDKIVDTDQHQSKGVWIDIDNSGTVADATAAADSRIRTVTSNEWTLVEALYEVNDQDWFGIADDLYTVADVEEIRGVMFWGDFANTNLTNAGSLWFDNVQMEVFKDLASVTPNTSPNPALDEGGAPGDFDNDQDVDGQDLAAWRTAFGAGPGADADGDGDSDGADFLVWQQNVGGAPVTAIPEPASCLMLMACLAGWPMFRQVSM